MPDLDKQLEGQQCIKELPFKIELMENRIGIFVVCVITLVLSISSVNGQSQHLSTVNTAVEKNTENLIAIFKGIHENPELGFMEVRTAGIIANQFKELGYEVTESIGKTGVVGMMKNGDGPKVMYRADMDCNAVKETTGLPYASKKIVKLPDGSETPVMHACGHDAHVTWMIGVAAFFAQHKELWKGTVIFVGQPAEESILGAEAMVNDGLYSKYNIPQPDYLFGIHTAPIAVGMVAAATGVRMAGTDQLDVTFHGIGGHGSTPNLSKDPIVMAAAAIMQYQAIVSRGIDPKKSAVITVGSVQAGTDNNVIPPSALLKVNLRWFDEDDRKTMINGITRINEGIAHAYNLPKELYPTINMKGFSYPLDNSQSLTQLIQHSLDDIVDPNYILKEDILPSIMGSEDFHHLVIHNAKKDYSYIQVGVASPKRFEESYKLGKLPFNAHNGDFEVDLTAIPFGAKVGITSMLAIFNQAKE